MRRLIIIGASGHGKVVAEIAEMLERWPSIVFVDNHDSVLQVMGVPVIGQTPDAAAHVRDSDIFVGIGNNALRRDLMEALAATGAHIPTLVHPSAVISSTVELGSGTVVMAGAVINCATRIGKGCIINTGATVDHDNVIGDYVHVSPGAHLAGAVSIGPETWLGIGCTVSNNIRITGSCTIGAGAVVVRDIDEAGTYIGVPARRR